MDFVVSLDVAVLFLDVGPVTLGLRTCLLMLPWALGRFYTNLAWALSEGRSCLLSFASFSLSALASARSSTSRLGLSGV